MRFYELSAIYDSRASFYGKAHIIDHEDGKTYELQSYDTIVARVESGSLIWDALGEYSMTTNRHIREFIRQFVKEA